MKKDDSSKNRKINVLLIDFVYQVGLIIVLPLVIFALIGKLVDEQMKTSPFFFFSGLLVGLIIAGLAVWNRLKKILKAIDRQL